LARPAGSGRRWRRSTPTSCHRWCPAASPATWAGRAADDLLATGEATVTTCRGTVQARLARPRIGRAGTLSTESEGDNGVSGSSGSRLRADTEAGLRDEIRRPLIWAIIDLVGG
jgi:hypothetical protein